MSSTRSTIAPPPFAANALTVIPPTPVAGVSYRDPIAGPASSPDGWPYAERVNSAEFNQIMYQISTVLANIDQKGVGGWTNLIDYTVPALVYGSNGLFYIALQASGPSTAAQDPISAPTFWQQLDSHGVVKFDTAGVTAWPVPLAMQLGYIKPTVSVLGGGGGGGGAGATAAGQLSAGGGGAAGGYSEEVVDLTGVTSVSVTVGAAGAAGVGGVSNGGAGGTTSFGAFLSATGGSGGINLPAGTTATYAQGGAPSGLGSSGDLNARGGAGHASLRLTGNDGHSGAGGDSFFSGGGVPIYAQSVGSNGILGSGGSGSLSLNGGAATNGGLGGVGLVLVKW